LQRPQHLEALQLRHDQVEQDEVRRLRAGEPQRLLPVDRRDDDEAVLAERRFGRPAQEPVVLGEEDPRGRYRAHPPPDRSWTMRSPSACSERSAFTKYPTTPSRVISSMS